MGHKITVQEVNIKIQSITFLRSNPPNSFWQISQFDQAMMDNGQIDNC